MDEPGLPLPQKRCLTKEQAAEYLGIGVTLLTELRVPFIKLGRRCVYDKLDLDTWLEDHKQREYQRAGKEQSSWLVNRESIDVKTHVIGGSILHSQMGSAYAEALKPKTARKPKPT